MYNNGLIKFDTFLGYSMEETIDKLNKARGEELFQDACEDLVNLKASILAKQVNKD